MCRYIVKVSNTFRDSGRVIVWNVGEYSNLLERLVGYYGIIKKEMKPLWKCSSLENITNNGNIIVNFSREYNILVFKKADRKC